jgi:hypothetical protein
MRAVGVGRGRGVLRPSRRILVRYVEEELN